MTWKQTIRAAKADGTLRYIVTAIIAANRARTPDRVAYAAFRDRCEEMGLVMPNEAYWGILLSCVAGGLA